MATQQQSAETDKQQQGQSTNQQTQRNQQESSNRGLAHRRQSDLSHFGKSPFSFMRRFSEEMDRLFEDFGFGGRSLMPGFGRGFAPDSGEFGQTLWSPQIETFEREGQLVIRADLPGLNRDDVNVEITDDAIMISGERRNENEEKREGYYRSERSYGRFYRQIPLPEGVNADDAKATFRDGVLEIAMQAPQLQSQRRRLEISEGGSEEQRSKAQSSSR
jgi:HSP20 family protein